MPKDSIVEAVRKDLLDRSKLGIEKYGTTLDRTDLSQRDWMQHHYEELLDAANYMKKLIILEDERNNLGSDVLGKQEQERNRNENGQNEDPYNTFKSKSRFSKKHKKKTRK